MLTEHDRKVIEVLRQHVRKSTAEDIELKTYPEENGLLKAKGERPCDAIWQGPHREYAVEHTTIDSFSHQRKDDARFLRVMGELEKQWSEYPDEWIEIVIESGVIPTGFNWDDLRRQIREWLLTILPTLPMDSYQFMQIPNVPFGAWLYRDRLPGAGKLVVMRTRPENVGEQTISVIRRALDNKKGVLGQYKSKGFTTILLLEYKEFALGNRRTIFRALKEAYRQESDAPIIDHVYIALTATCPWCIVPFKEGSLLLEKPTPYWPTAPNYPMFLAR